MNLDQGQISHEKLVANLPKNSKTYMRLLKAYLTMLPRLKNNYEFLLNIIISMPEIQNNPDLTQKISEKFPEDSHP